MVPLVWCLGAGSCPAVSLAPKDHLTRLCDSVRPASSQVQGHPPHSSEGSRCPSLVRGITVLLAKAVMVPVPPADMMAGFFSPSLCPRKAVGYDQSWVCASWTGPFINLLSRCSCRTASSDASVPKFGLQHLTWKTRTFMCRSFRATGHSCGLRSKDEHLSTGPALRAVPIAPCLHESSGGSPCSLERTGRAHSQLPRRLAHTGSVSGSVMRTQGFGALAPQPVGPSGQLGKEQTLADAEDLFSRYGVWIRSIRQRASRRNALSRCWTAWIRSRTGRRHHWNSFRGSWGIWQLRRRSHRWGCSIWDRLNTGSMAESRGGRGRAARCGSKSLQPAAKPSPRGQTFHFFGQECPWNRSPGTLWFTRMPPPRAGGPRSTGLQCRGFGRVPNCTGISTA